MRCEIWNLFFGGSCKWGKFGTGGFWAFNKDSEISAGFARAAPYLTPFTAYRPSSSEGIG